MIEPTVTKEEIVKHLETVANFFAEDQRRWTQHSIARDKNMVAISALDPEAHYFCLMGGSIKKANENYSQDRYSLIHCESMNKVFYYIWNILTWREGIGTWQDSQSSCNQIIEALQETIKLVKNEDPSINSITWRVY